MAARLSYISTPMSKPYIYQSLPERLRELASEDPDREAFVFYTLDMQRISITRQKLLDQSTLTAKKLIKTGFSNNTTVGFCMNNSIEMLIMNMAVVMAGGIPFYLPTNLKDGSDLINTINGMKGEYLFIDTAVGDANSRIIDKIWPAGDDSSIQVPTLQLILCNGQYQESTNCRILQTFLNDDTMDTHDIELPVVKPEDTLTYFCTSGSTGKPKEVIHTHYGIFNFTKGTEEPFGLTRKSRYFCDRTFGWAFGYPRTYLTLGVTRVFVNPRMSTGGKHVGLLCDIIETEKCDVVYLPGYMAVDIITCKELAAKFNAVNTIVLSGDRVPKIHCSSLLEMFCRRVCVFYGTTETGGCCAFVLDNSSKNTAEDGIIGIPFPGAEMKIVDTNSCSTVEVGNEGELCIRCSFRFAGYRNMDAMFRQAVDNQNWFHTGDVARMRDDGNIVIEGRIKQWISTGTSKYFPWIIEYSLSQLSGVACVVAVGVPDPRLNQVVCVCVVPSPDASVTAEYVMKFCDDIFVEESTTMGVSLKPRYCLVLDEIPLTSTGKIDRNTIRIHATEVLGL